MAASSRLKWRRVIDGYQAYPMGHHIPGRYAKVWKSGSGINTDVTPHRPYENWAWCANWEGWFSRSGFAEGRQPAADRATEEWWAAIDTEMPRDVDLEVELIVARVLVRPIPNSLLGEDAAFLRGVMWHLNNIYGDEIKHDTAPEPVRQLVSRLSEELFRRREAGEYKEPTPYVPSTPRRRRR